MQLHDRVQFILDQCMNIVELYHLPSPFLSTIRDDVKTHQNYDEYGDDRNCSEVDEATDGVKQENQASAAQEIKHGDTRVVVGTSGTKSEHQHNIKAEDKPHDPTTCLCTRSLVKQ